LLATAQEEWDTSPCFRTVERDSRSHMPQTLRAAYRSVSGFPAFEPLLVSATTAWSSARARSALASQGAARPGHRYPPGSSALGRGHVAVPRCEAAFRGTGRQALGRAWLDQSPAPCCGSTGVHSRPLMSTATRTGKVCLPRVWREFVSAVATLALHRQWTSSPCACGSRWRKASESLPLRSHAPWCQALGPFRWAHGVGRGRHPHQSVRIGGAGLLTGRG